VRIDFVFPKFKLLSGAERLILSLAKALTANEHRVRILCHRFDPSCQPLAEGLLIEETGVRLEWSGNHYLDSLLSYLLAFRLRRRVAPDTEVVCLFGPALALAWRRGAGAKRVLYFCYEPPRAAGGDTSDVVARIGRWRWLVRPVLRNYRFLDRWLVHRVDGVLVNGEYGRQLVLQEYGLPSWPITHGVDFTGTEQSRAEARQLLGIDPSVPVVLSVNFLHPRKRVDLLLRCWLHVERQAPSAELLIVGDGPESSTLRDLAARLRLARVHFCGFVAEESLPRYYRAADLLAHAAREETFGLTILEAGAFGLPVVVTDEGGPRYTVRQGETGLRVAARAEDLAEAILSLLSAPETARAMGERGRAQVSRHFRWEQGARDFLAACRALGVPE
jgi:glycosyltransferase involved in cell wall biosynthesis